MDGWAALTENTFGIQGSFYTFKDDMDSDNDTVIGMSTIMPSDFAGSGTQVCASGNASVVGFETDGTTLAYGDYWGAAIGFNLSQVEGEDAALPYSATANGVIGFSFTIGGTNPIPADGEVRFNIKVAGDDHNYCQPILASGNSTFLLSEMVQDCWLSTPGRPTADATNLEALHWQFVTNDSNSYMFDLCVTELRAVTM